MRIGTKSVLFGAHQFLIHPWFVAAGWWKLYGFPYQPWLWLAFAIHDIGYIGKPNMDGPEGEEHPWTGARIMYRVQGWWLFVTRYAWLRDGPAQPETINHGAYKPIRWWELRRRLAWSHIAVAQQRVVWGNEVLFHSRFLAKRYGAKPSRLCIADKLAIALEPWWFYLPRVNLTGEVREYMAKSSAMNATGSKYSGMNLTVSSQRAWNADMCAYIRRWVDEHKDGREDTWTPDTKVARTESGVWS